MPACPMSKDFYPESTALRDNLKKGCLGEDCGWWVPVPRPPPGNSESGELPMCDDPGVCAVALLAVAVNGIRRRIPVMFDTIVRMLKWP